MLFYLATVHFQSCTLNVNKIDVVLCFRKLIFAFSLICFKVRVCKISDKSDTFSLNYSNLFRGPLFFGTQCILLLLLKVTESCRWHQVTITTCSYSRLFTITSDKKFTYRRDGTRLNSGKLPQNNGHYAIQDRSMSPTSLSNEDPSYDLVNNTNLHGISYCFPVKAEYWSNYNFWQQGDSLVRGEPVISRLRNLAPLSHGVKHISISGTV